MAINIVTRPGEEAIGRAGSDECGGGGEAKACFAIASRACQPGRLGPASLTGARLTLSGMRSGHNCRRGRRYVGWVLQTPRLLCTR